MAAIGNVDTVSISWKWSWEAGLGTDDPLNEILVTKQNVSFGGEKKTFSELEISSELGGSEFVFLFFSNQMNASIYVR